MSANALWISADRLRLAYCKRVKVCAGFASVALDLVRMSLGQINSVVLAMASKIPALEAWKSSFFVIFKKQF